MQKTRTFNLLIILLTDEVVTDMPSLLSCTESLLPLKVGCVFLSSLILSTINGWMVDCLSLFGLRVFLSSIRDKGLFGL